MIQTKGDIPKRITTVYRGDKRGWVADADNKKRVESIREAAGSTGTETTRDNTPMKEVKVVGIEYRSQGSSVYNVQTPDGGIFDMNNTDILQVMIDVGVQAGGILQGEYIWARVHTGMCLILVGSKAHKDIIEYMALGSNKIIKPREFEVGGIYQSKSEIKIFLGWYMTAHEKWEYDSVNQQFIFDRRYPPHKTGLWYRVEKDGRNIDATKLYRFETSKSFPARRKLEDLDINPIKIVKDLKMHMQTNNQYGPNGHYAEFRNLQPII